MESLSQLTAELIGLKKNVGIEDIPLKDLAVNPLNPQVIYAGTPGNGVFKSTDGGETWIPWNTGLLDLYISALTLDPQDPSIVYAGTNCGVFKWNCPNPDLDIQDYSGNLSANTMELTGVRNSIVVGSYVLINPDDWEKNVDLYDGPGNMGLDLMYSCTDLSTYGEWWTIPSESINPDINEVSHLASGTAAQNIVQVYIPPVTPLRTYVGAVTATGLGEEGLSDFSDSDEFTLKVHVVSRWFDGLAASFGGDPEEDGNHLYWTEFGLGEIGFNIYRLEPNSNSFTKLNESPMEVMEYKDRDVMPGETYQYKLGLSRGGSPEILLGPISFAAIGGGDIPVLAQNRPNPWKEQTEIRFAVPSNSERISLKVYNIAGELIKTLLKGPQEPGFHTVLWDGKDEIGKSVSSGVYFYKLTTGNLSQTKKMLLLR